MEMDFRRDDEHRRFYGRVDGLIAEISYVVLDDGTLDLTHTYVPEELRGRGVGLELVRRALDDVRRRGERIVPSCPFVERFAMRHPAYRDLLAEARQI